MSKPSRQVKTDKRNGASDGAGDLSAQCGADGDRYYRAMTDLSTNGGRSPDLARQTLEFGTAYLKSLDELIAQPVRRNSDGKLGINKLRAAEYRLLLLADLASIEKLIGDGDAHGDGGGK